MPTLIPTTIPTSSIIHLHLEKWNFNLLQRWWPVFGIGVRSSRKMVVGIIGGNMPWLSNYIHLSRETTGIKGLKVYPYLWAYGRWWVERLCPHVLEFAASPEPCPVHRSHRHPVLWARFEARHSGRGAPSCVLLVRGGTCSTRTCVEPTEINL